MSLPRKISGRVILVISGQGRMMYQSLEPEPGGAILPKRSKPQEVNSSPHDAGASMADWLETNIQGGGVAASRGWAIGIASVYSPLEIWYDIRTPPGS